MPVQYHQRQKHIFLVSHSELYNFTNLSVGSTFNDALAFIVYSWTCVCALCLVWATPLTLRQTIFAARLNLHSTMNFLFISFIYISLIVSESLLSLRHSQLAQLTLLCSPYDRRRRHKNPNTQKKQIQKSQQNIDGFYANEVAYSLDGH